MSTSILVFHHLGLGDHFMCHGIVREYAKRYDRIGLFALPHNYESVSFMYRDLDNIAIIKGNNAFAKRYIAENAARTDTDHYDEVKIIGLENLDWKGGIMLERQFYALAGVPLEKKWDSYYVKRDPAREQAFFEKHAPKGPYVFLHEDLSRDYRIDRAYIDPKYEIFLPSPDMTDNVFDYEKVIEKAAEIHVIDSTFMFQIDCTPGIVPGQKLCVHRYSRPAPDWVLPILKKDWAIIASGNRGIRSRARTAMFKARKLAEKAGRKIGRMAGRQPADVPLNSSAAAAGDIPR